jgi:hypothetical protein
LAVCGAALWADPASARAFSAVCDSAAQTAAKETGVPLDVLRAITRVETGRHGDAGLEPWPWTVNMEGDGAWFETEDAARAFVFRHFKRGARSFDVGCFQINYKWHSQAFRSIDEMFDPKANARYAAQFLTDLFAELGDWSLAAGAYHSRTPKYADRYSSKFEKVRLGLADVPADTAPVVQNVLIAQAAPLISRAIKGGQMGSLVPIGESRRKTSLSFFRSGTGTN